MVASSTINVALPPAGMPSPGTLTQAPAAQAPAAKSAAPNAAPKQAAAVGTVPPTAVVPGKNALPQVSAARGASSRFEQAISLYREGRKYAEQERFAQAVPLFDQAIQLDSGFALAYNARCYSFLRLRQYDRAIEDCSEAIKLDASYANAYQNRGVARHFQGDRAGSNDDIKRAAELQPVAQVQTTKIPGKQ
jgi:tetratricopeptide (TPR) repeat protein